MGKSIKVQRKESLLKEVIPEALSQMNDGRIRGLSVVDVVCSRDGSDAKVYLEKSYLNENEQRQALKQLKQARGYIQNYCLKSTGWFKVPNLSFTFDDLLEQENKMEELFEKIKKEKGE
ncbi:ribosome-binding factor A [Lebetimonas natsushimae]|uniref:Ribosome-binding factor A n=1 Tax=Lebetimonas natsushimae TaxID=1936991 RepID=A0A292YC75_9BACT|nr:30S ribosome-binding factor RbfA [Lebetimonas natsushimae]GAX87109.1 ribosome-binding factor A [Lebetimonas natsushimae]